MKNECHSVVQIDIIISLWNVTEYENFFLHYSTALFWQKETSDKSDIVKEQNVSVISTDVNGIS